jgi:hypothetical protein
MFIVREAVGLIPTKIGLNGKKNVVKDTETTANGSPRKRSNTAEWNGEQENVLKLTFYNPSDRVLIMKKIITICKVKKGKDGKNRWVVTHNDNDPESVGENTVCGMPCQASEVPEGTTFKTTLTIPD